MLYIQKKGLRGKDEMSGVTVRIATVLLAACMAGPPAGCRSTAPSTAGPSRLPPEGAAPRFPAATSSTNEAVRITPFHRLPPADGAPGRIDLLATPRSLLLDACYPPLAARHKLIWDEDGLEWRIRFPPRQYAYAAVALRRPVSLDGHYARMRLVFRVKPARLATNLAVGLVDRPAEGAPVVADVSLSSYVSNGGDGWTTVSIPLRDFPHGAPARALGADLFAQNDPAVFRPLDWSIIQEIRIISPQGHHPPAELSIRDIRLQRL